MVKYSYNYIKQNFKDQGCELLSTEYINNSTLMNYICNCGNKSKISFNNFKSGKRCKQCGVKKRQELRKTPFKEVKQYFKNQGCNLLSAEYTNAHNLLDYICNCGNKSKICFDSFKSGNRCKQCGIKKMKIVLKTPFKEVKQYFKNQGCNLLSTEYVNAHDLLDYICNCGNESKISFSSFKNGRRCANCGGSKHLEYDYIKQYFKDQGCELLSTEYINSHNLLDYICSCGNESKINFNNFKNGKRCNKCRRISKGEIRICQLFDLRKTKYDREVIVKEIGNKRYDFKLNNSFIEYHGMQHYCPYSFGSKENNADYKNLLNNIKSDQIKIDYCKDNQISLLVIPFWEFSRIESIIENFLNGEKIEISKPPKIVLKSNELRQHIRYYLKIESNEFLGGIINGAKY